MKFTFFGLAACIFCVYIACKSPQQKSLDMSKVFAWCIVPFDSVHRTPLQRMKMLKDLRITRYAYDWREPQLNEMVLEWNLAKAHHIQVDAVWLWLDARTDTIGRLSPANERMLANLDTAGLKTTIWLSLNKNYFTDLNEDETLSKAISIVSSIADRLKPKGCKLALYNHEDWFGEPMNEVKIIQALPGKEISMVYNFHHAHAQVDRFATFIDSILPYLSAVNVNGMRKGGPMILPIHSGDQESGMVQLLQAKGYKGPWGVLGHVENADVKIILEQNLEGLRTALN